MRLTTEAGKVQPTVLTDRTILIDRPYFRVERIPVWGSRASASLAAADRKGPGLSYLFVAAGSGRLVGSDFEPVDLPARSIAAVPALAPEFTVEDCGGLDLIRITPNWPGGKA